MGYLSTDQAADDALLAQNPGNDAVPAATGMEGVGTAIEQGVAGIGDSLSHLVSDNIRVPQVIKDLYDGNTLAALKASPLMHPALAGYGPIPQPTFAPEPQTPEFLQDIGKQREQLERWINDKQYEGPGAQFVGNVVQGAGTFGVGTVLGGPFGGAALMGATGANDTYREDKVAGVDSTTAAEHAAAEGVTSFAGGLIPGAGESGGIFGKILAGAAGNVGLNIASRSAAHVILAENGYPGMAAATEPFDRDQLISSAILGAFMGLAGHTYERVFAPTQVDAAMATADHGRAVDSAPGIPNTNEAQTLHDVIFSKTVNDLENGRTPSVNPEQVRTVVDNIIPHPAQAEGVRATLDAALSEPSVKRAIDIDAVVAAAREKVANTVPTGPVSELPTAATPEGNAAAATPEAGHVVHPAEHFLSQLVASNGNDVIQDANGNTETVAQMAERMRAEVSNASSDDDLLDAAAACFARTGAV